MCISLILLAAKKVICLCVTLHLISGRKALLLLKLFRVKRCYMTNNTFCIYQNDYNNTVLGEKGYHLTDSTFFYVLKKMLFTFFYLTHTLFLYYNVDLVHIYSQHSYIQISYSFIEILYSYKRYVTYLHTCHIITYICHIVTYRCHKNSK